MAQIQHLIIKDKNWVATDGSYGFGDIIIFGGNSLTDKQWVIYEELPDEDKHDYILAILDEEDLSQWEDEWEANNNA